VPARILRTRIVEGQASPTLAPALSACGDRLVAHCGGGGLLHVMTLELERSIVTPQAFASRFGTTPIVLGGTELR
jgi:hypothetical protein